MDKDLKKIITDLKPSKPDFKQNFEQEKQKQIQKVTTKYVESCQELRTELEWCIGMLLYDHSMTMKQDKKSQKEFLKRIARLISKELGETCSQRELQDYMNTYLAYSLEEVIAGRWIKGYDFRNYEELRPEFCAARETLIEKIEAKGW